MTALAALAAVGGLLFAAHREPWIGHAGAVALIAGLLWIMTSGD